MGAIQKSLRAGLAALIAGMGTAVALSEPANAGIWHEYPPAANRTCAPTKEYYGTFYQVCLEFNATRSQVRTVAFINPGAYTSYQVNIRLRFGGDGPDIRDFCPTVTSNSSRACYTAFTDLRRPYAVAEATFGIAGAWMPTIRALDMRLNNKQQQDGNWCGPAAGQTVLATIGISAPPQSVLAEKMHTGSVGTHPRDLPGPLNEYIPATDWQYHDHYRPTDHRAVATEIVTSLGRGRPVIILVKPRDLPWSSSDNDFVRHYLVIHGYGGEVRADGTFVIDLLKDKFKVADPWSATEHSIGVETLLENADNAWVLSDIARIRT